MPAMVLLVRLHTCDRIYYRHRHSPACTHSRAAYTCRSALHRMPATAHRAQIACIDACSRDHCSGRATCLQLYRLNALSMLRHGIHVVRECKVQSVLM